MSEDFENINEKDPRLVKVLDLIAEVYCHHFAGGGLHVVIDDGNIDGGCLTMCQETINSKSYQDGTLYDTEPPTMERIKAEKECCEALIELSYNEREYVYAKYHEHI